MIGAVIALFLLGAVLSACGAAPVAENWPGLTVDGDTVYVISGLPQKVYMLDAETGVTKQTFMPPGEFKGAVYWSPVAVGGDLAFVGFADPTGGAAGMYAFDPEMGVEQWHIPVETLILPAPVYDRGVVYFGDSDGRVYAVDVETHAVKPGWPFQTEKEIWASPLVDGDRVYVAAMDHHVYCLDAESGDLIWKQKVSGAMAAPPLLDDGILYVGTFDGRVYALQADSGEPVEGFEFRAENWIWSEPIMVDDQLFVTSLDGKLYALDPSTGTVLPPYPYNSGEIDNKDDVLRAGPVEAQDLIVVASQSGRVIATQDGQRLRYWPTETPEAEILTTPIFDDGVLYAALVNGQVYALDMETEIPMPKWSFTPPESD